MAISQLGQGVVGIDEVGRGALAGPVVVVAALVTGNFARLKDSKKLSAKQREKWYAYFIDHPQISFAVARVYPRQIEKRNISGAANLAALRAHKKLIAKNKKAVSGAKIFLDGGLFLGNGRAKKENPYHAKTIVKGDEKINAVAAASIIAKVHRDRFMLSLAKKYPQYGFEIHKGYGTKRHREALARAGASEVHRKNFLANFGSS